MNGHAKLADAVDRLAVATSVIRVRAADARRKDVNGGTPAELAARMNDAAATIEQAAQRLQESIG